MAAKNVLNFSFWGGYYQQSLYGDRAQIVTYIEPMNAGDVTALKDIARRTSRDILDVCMRCDLGAMRSDFAIVGDLGASPAQYRG